MWLLPVSGSSDKARAVVEAYRRTGATTPGCVVALGPVQRFDLPVGWSWLDCSGRTYGDALRAAFGAFPALRWYGLLRDGSEPRSAAWDIALADPAAVSVSEDGFGAMVVGGDLARALGGLAPTAFEGDEIWSLWEGIGRDIGQWQKVSGAVVSGLPLAISNEGEHRLRAWRNYERQTAMLALFALAKQGAVKAVDLTGVKVTFATPCYGGKIDHTYVQSIAQTIPLLMQHSIGYNLITVPNESLIQRARNYIVAEFLKGDGTHLLFADADMGWEASAVLDLLAAQKDIVGAVGRRKEEKESYCWNPEGGSIIRCLETGNLRANNVGTGFMLIRRRVFETMMEKMPELKYFDIQSQRHFYSLFEVLREKDLLWSEDYTFCNRWRALGGEVWVNPLIRLKHVGEKTYEGALFDQLNQPAPGAAVSAA